MKEFFKNKQNVIITAIAMIFILIGIIAGISIRLNAAMSVTESAFTEKESVNHKITLLALGVDKQVAMDERHPETNSIGQADAIFLVSIDKEKDEVNIVAIPRDTIVMIEKYNHKLQYMGTEEAQICLQYAYADGVERSCELTKERVEDLFPETTIDGYISINIQAITEINDAVGGVELIMKDEYTASQLGIPVGETYTLKNDSAMLFLRLRDKEETGSAYSRMDRMKDYITACIPQGLDAIKKNPGLIAELYQTLEKHMVTDIAVTDAAKIALALKEIGMEQIHFHTLVGELRIGDDGYEEFYPDEAQLKELRDVFRTQARQSDEEDITFNHN